MKPKIAIAKAAWRQLRRDDQPTLLPPEEDEKPKKSSRHARMMDLGKMMGDKLEEKKRHIEEKSRHIVEKMRENARM